MGKGVARVYTCSHVGRNIVTPTTCLTLARLQSTLRPILHASCARYIVNQSKCMQPRAPRRSGRVKTRVAMRFLIIYVCPNARLFVSKDLQLLRPTHLATCGNQRPRETHARRPRHIPDPVVMRRLPGPVQVRLLVPALLLCVESP